MTRKIVHRRGFEDDLFAFDEPTIKQILDKCRMLRENPEPEGKGKARLDGRYDALHRLRTGKFRIFHTYDDEKIGLRGVRRKTVKGDHRGKKCGDVTYDDLDIPELAPQKTFDDWPQPNDKKTPLRESITVELQQALDVPSALHSALRDDHCEHAYGMRLTPYPEIRLEVRDRLLELDLETFELELEQGLHSAVIARWIEVHGVRELVVEDA